MIQNLSYWCFLVLAVALFWLCPSRQRMVFISVMSIAFLALHDLRSVGFLVCAGLVFYGAGPLVSRGNAAAKVTTAFLVVAVISALAVFKYAPLCAPGVEASAAGIIVPLGASYYVFKLIHYIAESARGIVRDRSFWNFASYLFLFPMFTAGPIERYDHYLENRERVWHPDFIAEGSRRIIIGLIKKFFLVEILIRGLQGKAAAAGFWPNHVHHLSAAEIWGLLFLVYLGFYLDFSAYSDIAIGSCLLFGVRIMENFDYPVLAGNISEFWRRWHMTLMHWCRAYVYLPLIGLTRRPVPSVVATFLVFGLWHSASFSRIAWALYNAAGVSIFTFWSRFQRRRSPAPQSLARRAAGLIATQAFVTLSMALLVMEREDNISVAFSIMDRALGLSRAADILRSFF